MLVPEFLVKNFQHLGIATITANGGSPISPSYSPILSPPQLSPIVPVFPKPRSKVSFMAKQTGQELTAPNQQQAPSTRSDLSMPYPATSTEQPPLPHVCLIVCLQSTQQGKSVVNTSKGPKFYEKKFITTNIYTVLHGGLLQDLTVCFIEIFGLHFICTAFTITSECFSR